MSESLLRLSVFLNILLIMLVWEYFSPRRTVPYDKIRHSILNLGVSLINSVLIRIVLPTGLTAVALLGVTEQWGLWQLVHLPDSLNIVLSLVVLDLLIYWQHRLFHRVPLLWKLHKVHHSDREFDVTTSVRFHPIEIVFSLLIKVAAIIVLGVNPIAVFLFEIILSAMAQFNHGNVGLSPVVDSLLRIFVVTPDMHRVHHSVIGRECNSNYGFNISIWDRLFKSYCAQPSAGHRDMEIGLEDSQSKYDIFDLLVMPFKSNK